MSRAGTRYVDGGGYSYAAHAARMAGIEVAAVTRLANEDRRSTESLREAGVAVVVHECAASTLMRLEYPGDNVDERILTVAALAEPFAPEHVRGIDARAWLISASVRGEVPLAVVRALKATGALIGADVQGFVRVVAPDGRLQYVTWPEQAAVLGLVDILKTDAVEAEFLTGHADIHRAAATLAAQGPREIVLTHKDGVLVWATGGVRGAVPSGTVAWPQRARRHLHRFLHGASPGRVARRGHDLGGCGHQPEDGGGGPDPPARGRRARHDRASATAGLERQSTRVGALPWLIGAGLPSR